jgi:hypothetical protein
LALGILPSTWGSYYALPEWVNTEESFATGQGGKPAYSRDAALWQKVFGLVKPLGGGLWAPITQARCNTSRIYVERFIRGRSHVFTVYRIVDAGTQAVTLKVNKSLTNYLRPKARLLPDGPNLTVSESQDTYDVPIQLPQGPNALAVVGITPPAY